MADNQEPTDVAIAGRASAGWGLSLQWVIVSTVGLVAGTAVTDFVASLGVIQNYLVSDTVDGIAVGAAVGMLQQWVLRRRGFSTNRWVWATIGGMGLGSFAAAALALSVAPSGGGIDSFVSWFLYAFVFGAVVGGMQALVLKQWSTMYLMWVVGRIVTRVAGASLLHGNVTLPFFMLLYLAEQAVMGGLLVLVLRTLADFKMKLTNSPP